MSLSCCVRRDTLKQSRERGSSRAGEAVLQHLQRSSVGARQVLKGATIEETGLVNTVSEILKPQFLKLVEEIKRVCLYAAAETRGGGVSQMYLLGSIAHWPGSDGMLSVLMGNNIAKIPDPLALFPRDDDRSNPGAETAPEIVVATGAALRGMRSNV